MAVSVNCIIKPIKNFMQRKLKQYTNPFIKTKEPVAGSGKTVNSILHSAVALHKQGELNEAETLYKKILEVEPKKANAIHLLGVIAYQKGNYQDAVEKINQAIKIMPKIAVFHVNLGNALQDLQQFAEAVASYENAISLNPDLAEAHFNRATSLQALKQLTAAVKSYDRAISIKPNYEEAYSNRGIALKDLRELNAAVASFNTAIALKADNAKTYSNLGNAQQELMLLDAAIKSFNKAVSLKLDYAEANFNKSLLLLLTGDFVEGLKFYESRWSQKDFSKLKRNFSQPLWLGEQSLSGKTILLHAEQGLGDTIQFCRYVKMVAKLGGKVVLEVQKPLMKLLNDFTVDLTLISKGDPLPHFDFHCPLLSLPLAFKTDLMSIPCEASYLQAEPQRIVYWKDRLKGEKFKIGIAWQGSHLTKIDIGRSFELRLFREIAALPNVQLVSLQKGYGSEQMKNMPQGMEVVDLGDELDSDGAFLDSAAVMMNLDLVITSDTALAHLAGALGVKTWVALKYVPDWRWLLNREDSPWYPSMTLYRQEKMGDWVTLFDQMCKNLTLVEVEK
jgi:tetratricopeptide (TPR) repeat protein